MTTLLLGTATDAVKVLADALSVDRVSLSPAADGDDAVHDAALDRWRADVAAEPVADRVVVAMWPEAPAGGPVSHIDAESWDARAERPLLAWMVAMGAAARVCADGGAVVAVVERPAPLDCGHWAPETATADAVEALVRSLARSEGPRRVRVNAVTTPSRLTTGDVVAPPPPLVAFPGTIERDVAGVVRLLLADDAGGVTATVVHADCGRSWR